MNKLTIAAALVLALTGCQATQRQNATTGEYETNSTTLGAITGAVAGAAIGLATGDNADERRKRALIGAAAGGATGAGVGYYFDQQEAALRQQLLNSGVQVQRVVKTNLCFVWKMVLALDQIHTNWILVSTTPFVASRVFLLNIRIQAL